MPVIDRCGAALALLILAVASASAPRSEGDDLCSGSNRSRGEKQAFLRALRIDLDVHPAARGIAHDCASDERGAKLSLSSRIRAAFES